MSENDYIQTLIAEAGRLATQAAMNGHPSRVGWIPPQSATSNPNGNFIVVEYPRNRSCADGDPWSGKGI